MKPHSTWSIVLNNGKFSKEIEEENLRTKRICYGTKEDAQQTQPLREVPFVEGNNKGEKTNENSKRKRGNVREANAE